MSDRRDALHTVQLRNEFYRDNYRKMLRVTGILAIVLAGSIAANVVLALSQPEPRYFATRSDGAILPLVALNAPMVTDQHILQWSVKAASESYTFDFANWRDQWQRNASSYFTDNGWTSFTKAMDESGNLNAVLKSKLVVTGTPRAAPVILEKGMVIDGQRRQGFSWKVQFPMAVRYQSASETFDEGLLVTLVITRRSTLDHPGGIGIEQFIARRG